MLIREAAEITNIGYENAKVINRVYKKEGRDFRLSLKNRAKSRSPSKRKMKA